MQINEFDHPDHGWKWRACELRWIEAKIAEAVVAEREACAALCSEVGQQPSSLWHEHGCWTHAAQVCAESIALRSNPQGKRLACQSA